MHMSGVLSKFNSYFVSSSPSVVVSGMHADMQVHARVIYVVYELNKGRGREEDGVAEGEERKKRKEARSSLQI